MTQEENYAERSEEALVGIRQSIGLYPDDVLRKAADAMDVLIQDRGTDPTTKAWTGSMLSVLGALAETSSLLVKALLVELESTK